MMLEKVALIKMTFPLTATIEDPLFDHPLISMFLKIGLTNFPFIA